MRRKTTYLMALRPVYPAQRTQLDGPPQTRPRKHGVEPDLEPLVLQQLSQLIALLVRQ